MISFLKQLIILFTSLFFISLSQTTPTTYTTYLPPNTYVYNWTSGDSIYVWGNWPSSMMGARNVLLKIYSPGKALDGGNQLQSNTTQWQDPKSFTVTLNQTGQWKVWFQQNFGSDTSSFQLQIKRNGVEVIKFSNRYLDDNTVVDYLQITESPCILDTNFITNSTGGLSGEYYLPGSGTAVSSYSATSGQTNQSFAVYQNGFYKNKVWQTGGRRYDPVDKYTMTYICTPCSDLLVNCTNCTSKTTCIQCNLDSYVNSTDQCALCILVLDFCLECNSATDCDLCQPTYYTNSSQKCQLCSVAITNCLQCDNNPDCTLCVTNFQIQNGQCKPCINFMNHCLECTDDSTCTLCNENGILNTGNDRCDTCNSRISGCETCQENPDSTVECLTCKETHYLFNSTYCKMCEDVMPGCLQCNGTINCTLCDWPYYSFDIQTCDPCNGSIPACVNCTHIGNTCYECLNDQTFLHLNNTQCANCSDHLDDCFRCSSQTQCIQCINTTFYLGSNDTCIFCNDSMIMCDTCTAQTTCLTVLNDTYAINSANSNTIACIDALDNCFRCSDDNTCIECIQGFGVDNGRCLDCPQYCLRCDSTLFCLECQPAFEVYSVTGNCTCRTGWYIPRGCTEEYGCLSVRNITGQNQCIICDQINNFSYSVVNKECSCKTGFQAQGDSCREKCGDGRCFGFHQCDDGNILNGDGCSNACEVQSQFICMYGNQFNKSVCFIDKSFEIAFLYVKRVDGENAGEVHFSINPSDSKLSNYNLKQYVTQEIQGQNYPITSVYYDHQNSKIVTRFDYSSEKINKQIKISFAFAPIVNQFPIVSLTFKTENMVPQLTVNKDNDLFNTIYVLGQILSYLALVFFVLSLFFHKMIGVQTVNTIQIIYAMTVFCFNQTAVFRSMTSISAIFGITPILSDSKYDLVEPQQFRYLSQNRNLILNLNIFLIFLIGLTFTLIGMKFLAIYKKISYSRYMLKAKKLMQTKQLNKAKKELLKTEIQEIAFMLKDQICHLGRKVQILYERVCFPVTVLMMPPLLVLTVHQILTNKSYESDIFMESCCIATMLMLLAIGPAMSETRKVTSNFAKRDFSFQFFHFSMSCRQHLIRKFTSIYIALILFLCILLLMGVSIIVSADNSLNNNTYSLVFIIAMTLTALIAGIYFKVLSPYEVQLHNRALMFNFFVIVTYGIIVTLDNFSLLSQTVTYVGIIIVIVLMYVMVGLGVYRIFKESVFQSSNSSAKTKFVEVSKLRESQMNKNKNKQVKHSIKDTFQYNPYIYNPNKQKKKNNEKQGMFSIGDKAFIGEFVQQNGKNQLQKIKERLRQQYLLNQTSVPTSQQSPRSNLKIPKYL